MLKEKRATEETPFWRISTVPSASFGHLQGFGSIKGHFQTGIQTKGVTVRTKAETKQIPYSAVMRSQRTGWLAELTGVAQQESRTVESCRSSTPSVRTSTYKLWSTTQSMLLVLVRGNRNPPSEKGIILKLYCPRPTGSFLRTMLQERKIIK